MSFYGFISFLTDIIHHGYCASKVSFYHLSLSFVYGGFRLSFEMLRFVCFLVWQKKSEDDQPKLSKKKLRKMNRLSVAELKQVCVVLFGKLYVVKALFDCDFIKKEE